MREHYIYISVYICITHIYLCNTCTHVYTHNIYISFMKLVSFVYSCIFVYWVLKFISYFELWTNKNDSHSYRCGIDGLSIMLDFSFIR